MKLTSKGRYAVTALLDVAINGIERPVTLSDISKRQQISLSYLEQLFAKLRQANIVKSVRGPGGGYLLNVNPNDITVTSVIDAVNESVDATKCQGAGSCHSDGTRCLTHTLWFNLSGKIRDFLDDITLGQLMEEHKTEPNGDATSSDVHVLTDIDLTHRY